MFFLFRSPGRVEAPQRHSVKIPTFLSLMLSNSVLTLVVAGCGGRGGQGLHRAGTLSATEGRDGRSSLPLIPSEADLNLGQVAPGSQKSRTIWLTNQSAASVEIVEIMTSCDCLKVELPERLLVPGQQVEGRMELDLRKESHFLGNLGIIVTGRGKSGELLFEMKVRVGVGTD